MNGEFFNKAFSSEEQSAILLTNVDNSTVQNFITWNKNSGNNTQDRIFLLSYAEANRYLGVKNEDDNNIISRAAPTAYAISRGAFTSESDQTADGIMDMLLCWNTCPKAYDIRRKLARIAFRVASLQPSSWRKTAASVTPVW